MNANLPNFLIVGTAKAGTTSLYYYLKRHPEVYMSPVKEPLFFICNCYDSNIVKTFEEYSNLFSRVKNETAIGEASAAYLYHYKEAIPKIKSILGKVKIIIILRNPVDRAFSNYMHHVRDGKESLAFEDALKNETDRIKDNWLSSWHYTQFGFYYKQVKAYFENFSNVGVWLFDDLKNDPARMMSDIYRFLGVDSSFKNEFLGIRYNATGVAKNKLIHHILAQPNPVKSLAKKLLQAAVGEDRKMAISQKLRSQLYVKKDMRSETRRRLIDVFRQDVVSLEKLIGRDLSHWLQ